MDYLRKQAATEKQMAYALSLLNRVKDWERSGIWRQFRGLRQMPTEEDLRKMSTARLSKLIDALKNAPPGVMLSGPARKITPRQFKYILGAMKRLGPALDRKYHVSEHELKNWSISRASDFIDMLKHMEASQPQRIRVQDISVQRRPKPSSNRPASPKQVAYALKLIRRIERLGGWFDSDLGQGMPDPPSRYELEHMTSAEISEIIDSLRGEL